MKLIDPTEPHAHNLTEETGHAIALLRAMRCGPCLSDKVAAAVEEAQAALRNVQLAVAKEIVNQRS